MAALAERQHGVVERSQLERMRLRESAIERRVRAGAKLLIVRSLATTDDHIAVIGENRKLLIFPLTELPVMARGQGVALQKYKDGGLSDATGFALADGLSWRLGGSGTRRVRVS